MTRDQGPGGCGVGWPGGADGLPAPRAHESRSPVAALGCQRVLVGRAASRAWRGALRRWRTGQLHLPAVRRRALRDRRGRAGELPEGRHHRREHLRAAGAVLAGAGRGRRAAAARDRVRGDGTRVAHRASPGHAAPGRGQPDPGRAGRSRPAAAPRRRLVAGIKLTPLIFVVYLLITRRVRAAAVAAGTFAVTVAAGFVLLPSQSRAFWLGGVFLDERRVGNPVNPANHSLSGAVARLAGGLDAVRPWWVAAALLTGLAGLAIAALAHRRGHRLAGVA